jgi:hypothetical protein
LNFWCLPWLFLVHLVAVENQDNGNMKTACKMLLRNITTASSSQRNEDPLSLMLLAYCLCIKLLTAKD